MFIPLSAAGAAVQALIPANDIAQELEHDEEDDQIDQTAPQSAVTAAGAATADIPEIEHNTSLL